MSFFKNAELACRIKDPMNWTPEGNLIVVQAMREFAEFHYQNSKEVRFLYDREKFDPKSIREEKDLARIPAIGVTAMKYYLMLSLPEREAVLKLTSSGTGGQKTQIWFDEASLARVQNMLDVLWQQEGLVSNTPTNYCCFIYDPEQAQDLGIAFSVKNEERFAPVKNSYFTVKKNHHGVWEFQFEETVRVLKRYAEEGAPVRLLGIPSFIFELIEKLKALGPIKLPPNSYVLTGGGWKAAEDKSVTRAQFRQLVEEYLGIPDANQRDGFGMAEHSAPYIECDYHRFHIPVYNRIISRDPVSLKPLENGQIGLLEFLTPYNAMMPNLAILSTDLGFVDSDKCECGRNSPTFTLVGRGGLSKHKGCAITAGDIVKRK